MSFGEHQHYKIGIMMDMPGWEGFSDTFPRAVQFALDEAHEQGLIDRPATTVLLEHNGQPFGDGWASRNAFKQLVDEHNVLAIAGPMTSDNCLAVLNCVEEAKVPCITICGTQDFVGEYAFNLSNGNLADEPAYIAAWLKSQGVTKVAVLRDYPSRIGVEYSRFFEYATQQFDIQIVGTGNVYPAPSEQDVTETFRTLSATNAQAVVYLGFGAACSHLNSALSNADWNPLKIMCSAFVQANYHSSFATAIEGWHGIDQFDEGNARTTDILDRYQAQHKQPLSGNSSTTSGYDIGKCLALGMARMEIATPESLARALETIRMLPAVTGGPGTYITFGPYDHRGYKGLDYLNIRVAQGGATELVDFRFDA